MFIGPSSRGLLCYLTIYELAFGRRKLQAFGRAVRLALPFLRVEVSSAARLRIPGPEVLSRVRFPPAAGKATCVPASVPSLPVHPVSGDATFLPKSRESSLPEASVPRHTRRARPARRPLPSPTFLYPPQTQPSRISQHAPPAETDDNDRRKAAPLSTRLSPVHQTPT